MSLDLIRNVGGRGRALGLGAIVALACSACASEEVATAPYNGGMPPATAPAMAASDSSSAKKVAAAPPMAYPWMNAGGPSLPTASANAPVVR
jgi:hypothetical protein